MKASKDLAPGEHAYALTCELGLAHLDAYLRDDAGAVRLLEGDLCELMAQRGVKVELL